MTGLVGIHAGGSPYEIGKTIGAACRDRVQAAIAIICVFEAKAAEIDERLDQVVGHLDKIFPEAVQEARGLADGARVALKDALLLSFAPEIDGRLPGFCSLLAVPGENGPLLGKNLDTPAALEPLQVVQHLSPAGGIPFVHITTAGAMWSDGGVNGDGFALVNASLASARKEKTGIPDGYLVREALARCSTTDEAVSFLTKHSFRSAGENLILADASGNVAVLEIVPGRHAVARNARPPVVACNHALDPTVAADQAPNDPIRENSKGRRSALQRITTAGTWNEDAVFAALSDRHVMLSGADDLWTVASIAICPAKRRLDTSITGSGGVPQKATHSQRTSNSCSKQGGKANEYS